MINPLDRLVTVVLTSENNWKKKIKTKKDLHE